MTLKKRGVTMWAGIKYSSLESDGLHLTHPEQGAITLNVDTIVVCAGQTSFAPLLEDLKTADIKVSLIGGALSSQGLDAQRAIREGLVLANKLASTLATKL